MVIAEYHWYPARGTVWTKDVILWVFSLNRRKRACGTANVVYRLVKSSFAFCPARDTVEIPCEQGVVALDGI